ncbi:AAA family ATPase [Rahnella variigena]|uniref:AAA family ATPase n=1 Tax=Rahnella variigena TaxID=574964 RepID=UPI0013EB6B94|nr:AAA family ATPase [Rahnella variigena]
MKIDEITINDISCIKSLTIKFNDNMNFICGGNGIGKSSVLECVAGFFYGNYSNPNLKKKFSSEIGSCKAKFLINEDETETELSYNVKGFHPSESNSPNTQVTYDNSEKFIFIRTNRFISYKALSSISLVDKRGGSNNYQDLIHGMKGDDLKNWFVHQELFAGQEKSLSEEQLSNLEFAKTMIPIIDGRFKYSHIDGNSHDIIISSPTGLICFEYLSSGFKSCLFLLLGIIKEVEYRFSDNRINAEDFNGIILIDEPEMHLHPEWQAKISKVLTTAFPKVQFICATHSPHVIQESIASEVITLEYDNENNIRLKEISSNEYGFQGWTIEEILTDVMGMEDTRSILYKNLKNEFYCAIDNDDVKLARVKYSELLKIIHPNSMERKVIQIDMACLSGGEND